MICFSYSEIDELILFKYSLTSLSLIPNSFSLDKTPLESAIVIAFSIGGFSALITIPLVPKLKNYIDKIFEKNNQSIEMANMNETDIINNQNQLNIQSEQELDRIIALHNNAENFKDHSDV